MAVTVRIDEGEQDQPTLFWDSVWQPWQGQADWQIAGADETQNRGGLRARAALHTAFVLCLFTDKRIPTDHPLYHLIEDGDQRGWFGDGVDVRDDLHEDEMGSHLWIFERSYLTDEIVRLVELYALEATACLINQGVCARIDAQATRRPAPGDGVNLAMQAYAQDGTKIYDFQFADIWRQTANTPKPKPFTTVP